MMAQTTIYSTHRIQHSGTQGIVQGTLLPWCRHMKTPRVIIANGRDGSWCSTPSRRRTYNTTIYVLKHIVGLLEPAHTASS